jgi:flagellar basal body-associated protein FliL
MTQPDPFRDPTEAELEMIADGAHQAAHGRPLRRAAAAGVAAMTARIATLTTSKRNVLDAIDANTVQYHHDVSYQTAMDKSLAELNQQLREAQDRLREYQTQLEGLN